MVITGTTLDEESSRCNLRLYQIRCLGAPLYTPPSSLDRNSIDRNGGVQCSVQQYCTVLKWLSSFGEFDHQCHTALESLRVSKQTVERHVDRSWGASVRSNHTAAARCQDSRHVHVCSLAVHSGQYYLGCKWDRHDVFWITHGVHLKPSGQVLPQPGRRHMLDHGTLYTTVHTVQ